MRWTEYTTARNTRRFSKFVQSRFKDELVISPTGEIWFRDSIGGGEFFVACDRTDCIGSGVSQTEPLESALLCSNLHEGVMLDIGANVGIHSVRVALKRPHAQIFAFEPVSSNHDVLARNIVRNGLVHRIAAIHAAVGASHGTVMMPSSYGTGNWVGGTLRGVHNEKIPILTIDSFLKERGIVEVRLVKCDVEGYELHVLRGMKDCLHNMRPRLLLEIDETWCARVGHRAVDVFTLLCQVGYQYMRVIPGIGLEKPLKTEYENLESTSNFWFYPEENGPGQIDVSI